MATGVLYDVDGTLLDTNHLHVLAWSRALRECGLWAPMSEIHALIGMGSDRLLERLLGGAHPDVDAAHSRHYRALREDALPIRGARELLWETHRRGARVVLATSAKGEELDFILDTLGARELITAAVSSADVERSKPAPDIFALALERSGLASGEAIAVGDTVWDVAAASAAGLGCVAVTTGGIAGEVLSAAGALAVYPSAAALLRSIDTSPLSRLMRC